MRATMQQQNVYNVPLFSESRASRDGTLKPIRAN